MTRQDARTAGVRARPFGLRVPAGRRTHQGMSNEQARVRPGVPTGGEFAATVHAEPGITLAPQAPGLDPLARHGLEERLAHLHAAATEERLLRGALFADSVRKAAPGAVSAWLEPIESPCYDPRHRVVAFDANRDQIPLDEETARQLAAPGRLPDMDSTALTLDLEAMDRAYAEHKASTAVMVAAFDKAAPDCHQKMAIAASQVEATAVSGHVEAITRRVLEQDPEAVAVVVSRDEDSIYGASFRLSHAVRPDGSRSGADLTGLDDHWLQGTAFDDHVTAYLLLEDCDLEELNIPLRTEEDAT